MSENILDMLSNISDEPNLVEVDSLDDLLRMIIQPNIEVGTIFYHLKTRKYFAVYYITNEWVVFTTHKTYPRPSSNSLYLTNKGEIIFEENAPYNTFQFNIVKVHSHYKYKEA